MKSGRIPHTGTAPLVINRLSDRTPPHDGLCSCRVKLVVRYGIRTGSGYSRLRDTATLTSSSSFARIRRVGSHVDVITWGSCNGNVSRDVRNADGCHAVGVLARGIPDDPDGGRAVD